MEKSKYAAIAEKGETAMVHHILNAVDWVSVKLSALSVPFLFVGNEFSFWLGIIVMFSTLAYNCIRIYKELKNKK